MSARLRLIPLTAVMAVAAAVPAVASATTYEVKPGTKFADAAGKAASGDTIHVAPGNYPESVVVKNGGVTIRAEPGAFLIGSPSAAAGTPTLKLNGAVVSGLVVVNLATTGAAVDAGAAGVVLTDMTIVGTKGPAVSITGSDKNIIQRATVATVAADQSALSITSQGGPAAPAAAASSLRQLPNPISQLPIPPNPVTGAVGGAIDQIGGAIPGAGGSSSSTPGGPVKVIVDSTVLAGGANGAGVRAVSANSAPLTPAGAITVIGRHVTISGAASAVVADASAANGNPLPPPGTPSGNIAAAFSDSILLGKRVTVVNTSGTSAKNTATIDTSNRNTVADDSSSAPSLFVAPAKLNYHLRADAPVIGQGGMSGGESDTDLDGQPRSANGVSDRGADEFVNRPPVAAIAVSSGAVRQGRAVTFDGSKSTDPDAAAGGGIVAYGWSFGDGQRAATTSPNVDHVYAQIGTYTATLTVVDRQSGVSRAATVLVTVTDGVPPTVTVTSPKRNKRLSIFKRKVTLKRVSTRTGTRFVRHVRRVRATVTFKGAAADDRGLGRVVLLLRNTRKSTGGRCLWFDGKTAFKARSCALPTALVAKLSAGKWSYKMPSKMKLKSGSYELTAIAVDASGLASAPSVVKFKLR